MRKIRTFTLALVCAGTFSTPALAQIPVIDAENLVSNTLTSVMQTWNTIEAVLQTAYMVLEIAGIEDLADEGGIAGDLDAMVDLINEGAAIAWDLQNITQQVKNLFDLENAPSSTAVLNVHLWEMRRALTEAHTTAVRVQTLINTAKHTVGHILKLLGRISAFEGNMQANQNMNESLASLKRLEATQLATNTAFQRAMTLQAMEKPFIEESVERIKKKTCDRWCVE